MAQSEDEYVITVVKKLIQNHTSVLEREREREREKGEAVLGNTERERGEIGT